MVWLLYGNKGIVIAFSHDGNKFVLPIISERIEWRYNYHQLIGYVSLELYICFSSRVERGHRSPEQHRLPASTGR